MTNKTKMSQSAAQRSLRSGWVALLPLLLLAVLMAGMGVLLDDFSKVPMCVVFLLTGIASLFTLRGLSVEERVATFSRGAGSPDLLLMVWIFVLAGAFASSAADMGAVTETVRLTLAVLPDSIVLAGLFLSSCIVSLCIGTSVGTIVALVPVASGMAQSMGAPPALLVAAVVGGSFFGDNLSFISDTTVAATRTQDCAMRDKFRTNFRIVLPAALVCFALYVFLGLQGNVTAPASAPAAASAPSSLDLWRVLPYAVVLITALLGVNVLVVLCAGCLLTGVVGIAEGAYDLGGWCVSMAQGIMGMGELIIISMMAGGLLAVVRRAGGVTYLVRLLTRHVHGRRGAELCIAALVSLTNCCTANNTVAILSVGSISKDVSERFGVDRRRAASLLDIFSCVIQGILPYGAQLLMAGGLAALSPMAIVPHLYYPALLALCGFGSIFMVRGPRRVRG